MRIINQPWLPQLKGKNGQQAQPRRNPLTFVSFSKQASDKVPTANKQITSHDSNESGIPSSNPLLDTTAPQPQVVDITQTEDEIQVLEVGHEVRSRLKRRPRKQLSRRRKIAMRKLGPAHGTSNTSQPPLPTTPQCSTPGPAASALIPVLALNDSKETPPTRPLVTREVVAPPPEPVGRNRDQTRAMPPPHDKHQHSTRSPPSPENLDKSTRLPRIRSQRTLRAEALRGSGMQAHDVPSTTTRHLPDDDVRISAQGPGHNGQHNHTPTAHKPLEQHDISQPVTPQLRTEGRTGREMPLSSRVPSDTTPKVCLTGRGTVHRLQDQKGAERRQAESEDVKDDGTIDGPNISASGNEAIQPTLRTRNTPLLPAQLPHTEKFHREETDIPMQDNASADEEGEDFDILSMDDVQEVPTPQAVPELAQARPTAVETTNVASEAAEPDISLIQLQILSAPLSSTSPRRSSRLHQVKPDIPDEKKPTTSTDHTSGLVAVRGRKQRHQHDGSQANAEPAQPYHKAGRDMHRRQ